MSWYQFDIYFSYFIEIWPFENTSVSVISTKNIFNHRRISFSYTQSPLLFYRSVYASISPLISSSSLRSIAYLEQFEISISYGEFWNLKTTKLIKNYWKSKLSIMMIIVQLWSYLDNGQIKLLTTLRSIWQLFIISLP